MKFILALLFTFSLPAFAAEGIETIQVKDNLYMLVNPMGGNVTVSIGEDGTFLVDDQLTDRSEAILAAAQEVGGQDVKFILNTHYHFDHTGGNEFFGAKDAVIMAHDNVRKRLSARQFIEFFNKEMLPTAPAGLPAITFSNEATLHYNGDEVRFLHTPAAHTDGDTIAHFTKANVIVAGDLIFNDMYPFIDIDHGGSIAGVIAGLDVVFNHANEETIIIPGHGKLLNKADLLAYKTALSVISSAVEGHIKVGKTLEETITATPTAEFDAAYGGGFISPKDFVTVVYKSLQQ